MAYSFQRGMSALVCAFIVFAAAATATAQQSILTLPATVSLGRVPVGVSVYKTITITNNLAMPVIVASGGSEDFYGYSAVLPDTGDAQFLLLAPNQTREVVLGTFMMEAGINTNVTRVLAIPFDEANPELSDSLTQEYTISVEVDAAGEPINIEDPASVVSLYSSMTTGFGLYNDYYWPAPKAIHYVNNTSEEIMVSSVQLWSGKLFTIEGMSRTIPAMLQPGDTLSVAIRQPAESDSVYYYPEEWYDELLVTTGTNAIALTSINIAAVRPNPTSVHQEQPSEMFLTAYPNPGNGVITITSADITGPVFAITDLLGNTIAEFKGENTWQWQTAGVSAGMYFLRVSGKDSSGRAVQKMQPIIINGK